MNTHTPILGKVQMEVFLLTTCGFTSKEIAERLCVGHKTVEEARYNILKKLRAKNMVHAVAIAAKMGLLDEPEKFTKQPKTKSISYIKNGRVKYKQIYL